MSIEQMLNFVPAFVLAFFRVSGMMLFAPLFGSSRIPRRVRAMLALVLTFGIVGSASIPVPPLPDTLWSLTIGIAGEMAFGIAMGMILSFVFIAVQWGGEMIGQQMGLNISQVLDPQFGQAGSLIGDLYFMTTIVIFLLLGGHHEMLRGVHASFDALPLLSLGMDRPLLDMLIGLLQGTASLALRLAGPVMITMLVVDLVLGCLGKTIPQLNVMTAGLTLRSIVGLAVLYLSMGPSGQVIGREITRSMNDVMMHWSTPRQVAGG